MTTIGAMPTVDTEVTGGIAGADLVYLALTRTPDRVAFVDGGRQYTYREMAKLTFAMARALAKRGLGPGNAVSLLSPNRSEIFAVQSAAQLLGCRYTPLHPLLSAADQSFILQDAEIDLLVFDPMHTERAGEIVAMSGCADAVSMGPSDRPDVFALADDESGTPFWPEHPETLISSLSYTGGTTGKPKGVVISHRVRVMNVMMTLSDWQLPQQMRTLLATPLSHSAGTMVLPTLLRGGTVHLLERFEPGAVLQAIERERITCMLGVPTAIYSLLDHPDLDRTDLSSLETFIYGSSPASPTRLAEAVERIGPVMMQLYGQTEAPNTVTVLRKEDHDPARPELLASCGQPMVGCRVQLQDEDGNEVPVGENGEICVRGRIVMDGYWKRPEETAQALRGGWLHTGDVARRDEDGYLYIVDRLKEVIISGGFNVYPREVEDVLGSHPAVAAAAVIGVPDERWGEAVKACVVLRPCASVEPTVLQELVRSQKGPIQAPKSIDFLDEMPQTPVGKPDKTALKKAYWSGEGRGVH
ncbi:MAG: AMP-binding protein [Ilumatobacteraceae bacterium]